MKKNILILAFLAITLILQLTLWKGETGIISLNALKRQIQATADRGNALVAQTKIIQRQVSILQNYPEATETLARRRLNMIKADEQLILFQPNLESPSTSQQTTSSKTLLAD